MEAIWQQHIYIVALNVGMYGICLWCEMSIVPLWTVLSEWIHLIFASALSFTHTKGSHVKAFSLGAMQGLVFCPWMLRRDASDSKCILEVQSEKRRQCFSITSVCVCVYASRINPRTDRKRDRDWQPVISAILSLPSPLHWYADRAFQLLSVFSSREVCVCLRLEARVCTKAHRQKALIDCLRGVCRRLRPAGLIAGSHGSPLAEGRTSPPGLNTKCDSLKCNLLCCLRTRAHTWINKRAMSESAPHWQRDWQRKKIRTTEGENERKERETKGPERKAVKNTHRGRLTTEGTVL